MMQSPTIHIVHIPFRHTAIELLPWNAVATSLWLLRTVAPRIVASEKRKRRKKKKKKEEKEKRQRV